MARRRRTARMRPRCASAIASNLLRFLISLRSGVIHLTRFRVPRGLGRRPPGLLMKYRSLEKLLAAGRFAARADALRLYRSIATMDRSAPLPSLKIQVPTWARAAQLTRHWELNRLANRLAGLAQVQT